MIEITDRNHKPTIEELAEYIENPLFTRLYDYMQQEYKALVSVEYSGDKVLLGWNVKFHKAGRALCRLYPKKGYCTVLVVVGCKEKERVEALLPHMSATMQQIYEGTVEGMGQRWLLLDLNAADDVYQDVLSLVRIRRNPERIR